MNENDYFKIAGGVPKENNTNNIAKDKPVYKYDRDNNGNKQIITKAKEKNIIDNDIVVDYDRQEVIKTILKEDIDKLSRIHIEIEILNIKYNQYNNDVYKKQKQTLETRRDDLMSRIRILRSMME